MSTDSEQWRKRAARLDEIAQAIADRNMSELSMRVPAEPDRDADLVISSAAAELRRAADEVEKLREHHPDGYAVVQADGAFVGAWRNRAAAELVLNRSQAAKGERIVEITVHELPEEPRT